jgi:PPOX class probable F420-dependent enzyme
VHWIEVRGAVDLSTAGAMRHLDGLAARYAGARRYFGDVVPADLARREVPVMGRIAPIRVVTDVDAAAAVARTRVGASEGGQPHPRPGVLGTPASIPASHRDLLRRPLRAALGTVLLGGQPQTQPVWFDLDGDDVLVHTTRESRKGRNLLADPRATLLVVDPDGASRWIEIRGDVEITTRDALDRLDRLTRAYTGHPRYYGRVRPASRRDRETRIVCRIRPVRVVCDAIHR